MSKKRKQGAVRSSAEWAVLVVCAGILIALVSTLLLADYRSGGDPPDIRVKADVGGARHEGDQYYVPVTVENVGDTTADTALVEVTLERHGSEPEVAELEFRFLAGGQSADGAAVFDEKPADDTVTTSVVSYTLP